MTTKREIMGRWQALAADQSGGIAISAALVILVVMGFAALTLDIGHLISVKSELQKAAEAGALAGARALALPMDVTDWNWENGKASAVSTVQKNVADNLSLGDFNAGNVQTGFWDLTWTSETAPANLLGSANPAAFVPAAGQVAAVKVTLRKTQDGTGSSAPMAAYFAAVLGISSMGAQASAVAMISPPTIIPYPDAFPFALPETWVKQHWKDKPPLSFGIAANQHVDSGGQWTSFKSEENSANYIDGLIMGTNTSDSIAVGDQIYIQTGERASIYNVAQTQIGKIRYVPVVTDGFQNGAYTTVMAYVPFQITSVHGSGNDPTVIGHFVPGWIDPNASGAGGKYFGDPLPPKLVN
jgi:Flp pilus assembly protein TadG